MTPHVRPSKEADCSWIAGALRQADRQECDLWGVDPLCSLREGLAHSLQCLTVIGETGNPTAMFGVTPTGTVWLLGTEELFTFPVAFIKQSRLWVNHIMAPLSNLPDVSGAGNWVDMRNTKHTDWLIWVGFTLTQIAVHNQQRIGYYRKAI